MNMKRYIEEYREAYARYGPANFVATYAEGDLYYAIWVAWDEWEWIRAVDQAQWCLFKEEEE